MLGDIVVSYERMQEVEFSFFTLPDSGAFLTHAPRRRSEAFALVYPFQTEVWPVLIFTIIITGPILYFMIAIPQWVMERRQQKSRKFLSKQPKTFFDLIYIREITRRQRPRIRVRKITFDDKNANSFGACVWYTCRIFLRQCESHAMHKARNFLLTYFQPQVFPMKAVTRFGSFQLSFGYRRPTC